MVADIAHGFILACDFLSSLENPLGSFVFLCGVLYLLQGGLDCLRPGRKVVEQEEQEEGRRPRMAVERVDDSPVVELNTLTNKMKQKSRKIVLDAEQGEARTAIQKCKNFLSSVQSSNFACKIFINSWEDIDGIKNFDRIVSNIGVQLRLPKEDVEGIKLAALGGCSKRDYLSFDCAMKEKGQVRLNKTCFQILL